MKLYPKYPTAISALAFSPDGTKLAIGASYEHDNTLSKEEQGRVMILIKDTVMEDCKVCDPLLSTILNHPLTKDIAQSKSLSDAWMIDPIMYLNHDRCYYVPKS